MKYRRGAFVNLVSYDPADWRRQLMQVDALEGLDHIELWLEFAPTRRELAAIADLFVGRETIMHGPFIGMSVSSGWDALARISLDRWTQAVEMAAYLHCRVVTFHAGLYGDVEPRSRAVDRLAERFATFAESTDPVVTLENMPIRSGASREAIDRLDHILELWALQPSTRITLDTGHCLQNGDDPAAFVREHAARIANIHLHDGVRGGKGHLALGAGEMNLEALLQAMCDSGYDGYVTLETLDQKDTRESWATWRKVEAQIKRQVEPPDMPELESQAA